MREHLAPLRSQLKVFVVRIYERHLGGARKASEKHLGGIRKASERHRETSGNSSRASGIQDACRRHPGDTQEECRRLSETTPRDMQEAPGGAQEARGLFDA